MLTDILEFCNIPTCYSGSVNPQYKLRYANFLKVSYEMNAPSTLRLASFSLQLNAVTHTCAVIPQNERLLQPSRNNDDCSISLPNLVGSA